MSHITNVKLRVKSLESLKAAAAECGLEFREGQRTHKWYGRFVGDTTPPSGMDPKDYGKCLHALALKGDKGAYEIGVVAALDGGEGFDLVVDTWNQYKLTAAVGGPSMNKLRQEYGAAEAERLARKKLGPRGFVVKRERLASGLLRLRAVRR